MQRDVLIDANVYLSVQMHRDVMII